MIFFGTRYVYVSRVNVNCYDCIGHGITHCNWYFFGTESEISAFFTENIFFSCEFDIEFNFTLPNIQI